LDGQSSDFICFVFFSSLQKLDNGLRSLLSFVRRRLKNPVFGCCTLFPSSAGSEFY
jgi:hypothetical protein